MDHRKMERFDLIEQLKLELIREYEPYVRRVAGLTSTSLEDAREAFHSAICRMLVGLKTRPPGNPILAWRSYIVQAAVNQLREAARRVRRFPRRTRRFSELSDKERLELLGKVAPQPTPAQQLEHQETARILWAEVATLDRRQGDVLRRWAHGSSLQDIATSMGVKPGTVYKWWSRAIQRLRRRPRVQQLVA